MIEQTQEEVNKWEKQNQYNIKGWEADWVQVKGYKIVTFIMSNKSKMIFKIKLMNFQLLIAGHINGIY